MSIYWIPVVGFIVAGIEHTRAGAAHRACWQFHRSTGCWEEYAATWRAFDHVTTGFLSTMLFCLAVALTCQLLKHRAAHTKSRGEHGTDVSMLDSKEGK